MNKPVTIGQLLGAIGSVAIAFLTLIYNTGVGVGTLRIEIDVLKSRQTTFEARQDIVNRRIEEKQDKTIELLNDVKIAMQNKQDRKK